MRSKCSYEPAKKTHSQALVPAPSTNLKTVESILLAVESRCCYATEMSAASQSQVTVLAVKATESFFTTT